VRLETFLTLAQGGRLRLFTRAAREVRALHRLCFLTTAADRGVLRTLSRGPRSLADLLEVLQPAEPMRDAVEEWLEVGVRLGELRRDNGTYALRGKLARQLAEGSHDDILAYMEEAVTLHYRLLRETPDRARDDRPFTLRDQDGGVVSRSSRALEPLVAEAIDDVVPKKGALRLLEIGCGSAAHIRKALERNSAMTALGLEMQPHVAETARRHIAEWGLSDRVVIEDIDVRAKSPTADFDIATLHNNIYYFRVDDRRALLAHVRGFLKPGGRLLLTTGCGGGSAAMQVLSLWGAATDGCGRLPSPRELTRQLREAGFTAIERNLLLPGDSYFAFTAVNP